MMQVTSSRCGSLLCLLLLLAPAAQAVPPESGAYVLTQDMFEDDSGRFFHVELQDTTARLTAVAFNPESGQAELYVAEGELRDDALFPGNAPHPPAITEGYRPIHFFRADLFRVSQGACLTCSCLTCNGAEAPIRERIGQVGVWFAELRIASIQIQLLDGIGVPGVPQSRITSIVRSNIGHQQIIRYSEGSQSEFDFIQHDLRGEWVFVDQAPAGPYRNPVMRFNFIEVELDPPAAVVEPTRMILPLGANDYTITYRNVSMV